MSIVICDNCGRTTNTVCCDHLGYIPGKAKECYAAWENEKWVKGCAYDKMDEKYEKPFVDNLLKNKPVDTSLPVQNDEEYDEE